MNRRPPKSTLFPYTPLFRSRPMSEFPTADELRARYEEHQGFRLTDERARPLLAPYPGGEGDRRYYQDAAIRADRKSTRLNSSHANISYAVFCLKKKKN